jgi:ADP-heptose:LPS heptosyltransferase
VPVRIGQRRNYNGFFLTKVLPPADRRRPVVSDLGSLLGPLGIPATGLTTVLDPAPLEPLRSAYREVLGRSRIAVINPFVTLAPVGIDWSIWVQVAHGLAKRAYTVAWHGTSEQLERFRRKVKFDPAWRSADELTDGSLRSGAAMLAAADAYLGCDSGPLHLSAALGIPVVGVFPLESKLPRFAPQGRGPSRVVSGAISPEAILAAFDLLLS